MPIYNKLVRDKIPEIFEKSNSIYARENYTNKKLDAIF